VENFDPCDHCSFANIVSVQIQIVELHDTASNPIEKWLQYKLESRIRSDTCKTLPGNGKTDINLVEIVHPEEPTKDIPTKAFFIVCFGCGRVRLAPAPLALRSKDLHKDVKDK
jgi:hypothetical protein